MITYSDDKLPILSDSNISNHHIGSPQKTVNTPIVTEPLHPDISKVKHSYDINIHCCPCSHKTEDCHCNEKKDTECCCKPLECESCDHKKQDCNECSCNSLTIWDFIYCRFCHKQSEPTKVVNDDTTSQ